jgi:hypothetical protein
MNTEKAILVFIKEPHMQAIHNTLTHQVQGGGYWRFLQFDSGTLGGLRTDGKALGAGCGTVKSDAFIPDILFGIDLTPVCMQHDQDYSTCGFDRELADANFYDSILTECQAQGGGEFTCTLISAIYFVSVSIMGGDAYNEGQLESCKSGD